MYHASACHGNQEPLPLPRSLQQVLSTVMHCCADPTNAAEQLLMVALHPVLLQPFRLLLYTSQFALTPPYTRLPEHHLHHLKHRPLS